VQGTDTLLTIGKRLGCKPSSPVPRVLAHYKAASRTSLLPKPLSGSSH